MLTRRHALPRWISYIVLLLHRAIGSRRQGEELGTPSVAVGRKELLPIRMTSSRYKISAIRRICTSSGIAVRTLMFLIGECRAVPRSVTGTFSQVKRYFLPFLIVSQLVQFPIAVSKTITMRNLHSWQYIHNNTRGICQLLISTRYRSCR